jgi:beta-glucosidase
MTTERTGERSQLAALPLHEKIGLLSGADSWHTHGCPALGLRALVTSDGPAGVRGTTLDEASPSSSLPCPSALGATWDPDLVGELAAALGAEARARNVNILLAPTINLMRTPVSGRGFECFSEDPELTARIAVAYVKGVQSAGVAATVKHYVGNDSETERWTYDARIAEQVLRELYLVPFEACVKEAGAAVVMAAYNSVNGSRMTEHRKLLRDVLKREWGFTGLVVSDWDAARSTVAAALGGLDLAMPGPNKHWSDALVEAVRSGVVPEEIIDDKIIRLLRIARKFGAAPGTAHTDDGHHGRQPRTAVAPALLRRAVAASLVLLHNDGGVLPLTAAGLSSVALIGPNAISPVIQGGGSVQVVPASVSTPARALATALAGKAAVTSLPGCHTWHAVPPPPAGSVHHPDTGEPGIRLEFRSADGTLAASEHRDTTTLVWWDGLPPGFGWGGSGVIKMTAVFRASANGPCLLGAAGVGHLTLTVDGSVVADGVTPVPADPVETMTRPGEIRAEMPMTAGQQARVEAELRPAPAGQGPVTLRLGIAAAANDDTLIAEAVAAASQASVTVVVAGSAEASESEGFDRADLSLPGRQDELIARVAAANPRTVVVVNAGMPVLMPWARDVAAVLYAWLPGQAMGDGLVDVLFGAAEPGGRLPVTLPATAVDAPVLHAAPRDGRLDYAEGLLIGYRGYDAAGTTPLFPFGHGLGYTSWDYESIEAGTSLQAGADLPVRVTVRNTGARTGREVVQAYVTGPAAGRGRPVRVLGAFRGVTVAPDESATVSLRVPARMFAVFDEAAGAWTWPREEFVIEAGRSSRDLRLSATVRSS